jgi:hypothetical protein
LYSFKIPKLQKSNIGRKTFHSFLFFHSAGLKLKRRIKSISILWRPVKKYFLSIIGTLNLYVRYVTFLKNRTWLLDLRVRRMLFGREQRARWTKNQRCLNYHIEYRIDHECKYLPWSEIHRDHNIPVRIHYNVSDDDHQHVIIFRIGQIFRTKNYAI